MKTPLRYMVCLAIGAVALASRLAVGQTNVTEGATMAGTTRLGIAGDRFTINGKPTFLFGISYYGALGASREAMIRDLDDMQRNGFNWIRVWATWNAFGSDVSAVDGDGQARQPYFDRLKWLVAECDRRSMIVDVTLTRSEPVTGKFLMRPKAHRQSVETLVLSLHGFPNWYIDLANENNLRRKVKSGTSVGVDELKSLRDLVKKLDGNRLVTVSTSDNGDGTLEFAVPVLVAYVTKVCVDFISPHRPRGPKMAASTERATRAFRARLSKIGHGIPIHYQEPFRRGFRPDRWQPKAEDFVTSLRQVIDSGAAGWCLHNGDNKASEDGRPRRSFDLRESRLFDQLDPVEKQVLPKLAAVVDAARSPAGRGRSSGPLRVHPGNPRYFTDNSGKAIYMTGSHVWWNIVGKGTRNLPYSDTDFEAFLDYLESYGHNFTRVWVGFAYPGYSDYPWQRTGPGNAADGKPKFDMTKLDQSYFDHLRDRLIQLQDRGIYFSVMFFGSFNGFRTSDKWKTVAWHPSNNVNPELVASFAKKDGNSFFTTDPAALDIQRLLVRKMIDTVNDLNNLIWEIMNEANFPACAKWQNEMVNYVKSYEAEKPKQHLVGITAGHRKAKTNQLLKTGPADWISPSAKDGRYDYCQGGPAAYSDKIVISDVDHLWAVATDDNWLAIRKWVWQTFTRGNHPILMDQYNAYALKWGGYGEINPKWDPIRAAMGHTRRFAERFADLAKMLPDESIADSAYCLADAGREYLVYDPSGGAVMVNLTALQGKASYTWFNPQTRKTVAGGSVNGGDKRTFHAPFSGDSVLHITLEAERPTSLPARPTQKTPNERMN
jgi:hypothetical protein